MKTKLLFTITFLLLTAFTFAQNTISGKVLDQKGKPVPGANIYLDGTYDGATSSETGDFSFETTTTGNQTLVISFLLYETFKKEIDVTNFKEQTVKLRENVNALDAVVITAGNLDSGDKARVSVLKSLDIVTTAGSAGNIIAALQTLPGTQNVGGQFIPNAAIGQFTNESLDVYNAWNNNVFTVPSNMGGIYIIVMQNSNTHVSTGTATPTWHTAAYYEKSTDGGTSWNTMIRHTYADLAGTIVDNGNTLYWTGFLNVGDQVRVRFSCNATTNNIVNYGGLSITKLAQ